MGRVLKVSTNVFHTLTLHRLGRSSPGIAACSTSPKNRKLLFGGKPHISNIRINGLREEELPCRIADSRDLSVLEADGLRDFTSIASVHEALDHVIQIGRLQCAY
ncbi:hypothetical protein KC344_g128 [Hortaea werneckii]|nr:hypothetical protein KC344_g128 [Hortaea werneckii]